MYSMSEAKTTTAMTCLSKMNKKDLPLGSCVGGSHPLLIHDFSCTPHTPPLLCYLLSFAFMPVCNTPFDSILLCQCTLYVYSIFQYPPYPPCPYFLWNSCSHTTENNHCIVLASSVALAMAIISDPLNFLNSPSFTELTSLALIKFHSDVYFGILPLFYGQYISWSLNISRSWNHLIQYSVVQ